MKRREQPETEVWSINGVLYDVVVVDPKEIDGDRGHCDSNKALIQLSSSLAASPLAAVKRHELGHASWWESGAYHRHQRAFGSTIAEEIEEDVMERFLPVYNHVKRKLPR